MCGKKIENLLCSLLEKVVRILLIVYIATLHCYITYNFPTKYIGGNLKVFIYFNWMKIRFISKIENQGENGFWDIPFVAQTLISLTFSNF